MMEENMFRETLLESAPSGRKRKRWPMAMAFTAELLVAGVLVVLPLLSTGVISVSAHVLRVVPLGRPDIAKPIQHSRAGERINVGHPLIVPIATACMCPRALGRYSSQSSDEPSVDPIGNIGLPNSVPNLLLVGRDAPPAQPHLQRVRVSVMSEGQLVNKVEPIYPRTAILTRTEGAVKLHAIIARDGSIESLSVVSGHPMLAGAAVDAVRQWRYRPYYLNGDPVEVETFITVNFKKTND
jgi:periplasmic protein TonB